MNKPDTYPNMFADVSEFFMLAQPELEAQPFGNFKDKVLSLGEHLIDEEWQKEFWVTFQAIKKNGYSIEQFAKLMDDAVDTVYVIMWLMKGLDIPFDLHWKEVQKKNMEKFPEHATCNGKGCNFNRTYSGEVNGDGVATSVRCASGRLVTRNLEIGKVMKPVGWTPPDHWTVLYDYWAAKTEEQERKQEGDPHTKLVGFQQADYHDKEKIKRPNDALHGTKDE